MLHAPRALARGAAAVQQKHAPLLAPSPPAQCAPPAPRRLAARHARAADARARAAAMLLFVQVGQCGNQVGTEFWRCVSAQLAAAGSRAAALASLVATVPDRATGEAHAVARCVLVDAEPKAARSCAAGEPLLSRAPCALGDSGRGSNWAHGYRQPGEPGGGAHGGEADATLLRRALAAVRREVERCAAAPDIVLVHGLAGGTGGGLGCRLLEELRGAYGDKLFIASVAIAPRAPQDDTSLLAPLGTVLCLQFLQCYADAVLLFHNGELVAALERAARVAGAALPRVSLPEMNRAAGLALASALLPVDAAPAPAVRDIVAAVCPQPCRKFAEVHLAVAAHSAFETDAQAWASVAASLAAAAPRHDALDGGRVVSATASMLVLRGVPESSAAAMGDAAWRSLARAGAWPHVPWQPEGAGVTLRAAARPLAAAPPRSLTVVANRSSVVGPLRAAAEGAERLLASGAYLHWLAKFDVSGDAVRDAVEATRCIVDEYRVAHLHV